jgi:hypothetical protein
MRRYALIIGYAGEVNAEDFLDGVDSDIFGWKNFLSSPVGGGWHPHEVKIMVAPRLQEVIAELSKVKGTVDYALIVFSGHGAYSSTKGDTLLQLNKSECLESKQLDAAKKQTVILDCCREVVEQRMQKSVAGLEAVNEGQTIPNPRRARLAFETAVNACPEGLIVINACNIGEYSYDDEFGRGGRYTFAFLEAARNWKYDGPLENNTYKPHSVVAVHNEATKMLAKDARLPQNPKILKMRTAPYFPLCVWI